MDSAAKNLSEIQGEKARAYPGSGATVGQLLSLADAYFQAAYGLLPQVSKIDPRTSSAPARLCAIHAIESYLNAFLIFHDVSREEVRGFQHNLGKRTEMAVTKGLKLKVKTHAHLLRLNDQREYLIIRYGPEKLETLTELNRIFATLKEIGTKVSAAIVSQPYEQSDPRFKKYW